MTDNPLIRVFCRLLRSPRTMGFGVQSPWAYRFVRYVVAERLPYYAYEVLSNRFRHDEKCEERLFRFYFRLANYCQPNAVVDLCHESRMFEEYVKAGCRKVRFVGNDDLKGRLAKGVFESMQHVMLRCDASSADICGKDALLGMMSESSVLIMEGIHKCGKAYGCWQEMVNDNRVGVSFDLYSCGVLFFDTQRHKQTFKVNII